LNKEAFCIYPSTYSPCDPLQIGDVIEKYLVQERDIEEVMKLARSSKAKDTRTAAYELATMAASSDDNKFRIVAESG